MEVNVCLCHTREALQLSKQGTERLHIKTFGNYEGQDTICNVVEISIITRESLTFTALVVPFICNFLLLNLLTLLGIIMSTYTAWILFTQQMLEIQLRLTY